MYQAMGAEAALRKKEPGKIIERLTRKEECIKKECVQTQKDARTVLSVGIVMSVRRCRSFKLFKLAVQLDVH